MAKFRVASIDELPDEAGLVVEIQGKRLALFRYEGKIFAVDEVCPHRGGPLHEGTIQEGVLVCPWHLWQFELSTGESPVNPLSKVGVYRVSVEERDVFVEI